MSELETRRREVERAWNNLTTAVSKETGIKTGSRWLPTALAAAVGLMAAGGVKRAVRKRLNGRRATVSRDK